VPRVITELVADYLLASTIVVLLNVLFLSKLSFIGPPASNERTLLLFMFNVAQVVVIFAIFYRLKLPFLSACDALLKALLVFGTISYPREAEGIAGVQIVIDLVLLAVFLAFFVGRLGTAATPSVNDCPLSTSARRTASVILTRATSIVRPPAMMRSAFAVASPAWISSTICSIVKPCANIIASVQPSRDAASSSSARRCSTFARRVVTRQF
jgi:hypothetical protein